MEEHERVLSALQALSSRVDHGLTTLDARQREATRGLEEVARQALLTVELRQRLAAENAGLKANVRELESANSALAERVAALENENKELRAQNVSIRELGGRVEDLAMLVEALQT